jgi:hypothetical protein
MTIYIYCMLVREIWYSWVNKFSYGTHHLQATITMLLWMWFLNVWDNVPMDLKYAYQQYFTCMCFLGFIRCNKTFIACGFRKYENLFTHEYHISLTSMRGCGIWFLFCVITCSDCYPLSNQINLLMVINIWSIII